MATIGQTKSASECYVFKLDDPWFFTVECYSKGFVFCLDSNAIKGLFNWYLNIPIANTKFAQFRFQMRKSAEVVCLGNNNNNDNNRKTWNFIFVTHSSLQVLSCQWFDTTVSKWSSSTTIRSHIFCFFLPRRHTLFWLYFGGSHVDLTCGVCFPRNNTRSNLHLVWGPIQLGDVIQDYGSTSCDYTRDFRSCAKSHGEKKSVQTWNFRLLTSREYF